MIDQAQGYSLALALAHECDGVGRP